MEDACAPSTWIRDVARQHSQGRKLGHGTAKGWATVGLRVWLRFGGAEWCHAAHADLGI